MQNYKYDWGTDHKGQYIAVENVGQAYNVLLLVQAHSKKAKRGLIQVHNKPFPESIKVKKPEYGNPNNNHYHIEDLTKNKKIENHNITLEFSKYKAKTLYIRVLPNGKAPYEVKRRILSPEEKKKDFGWNRCRW